MQCAVLTGVGQCSPLRKSSYTRKTQVWNRGGVVPSGIEELTRMARRVKPEAVVWRGDPESTRHEGVRGAHRPT